jgi:DNA modification methylase
MARKKASDASTEATLAPGEHTTRKGRKVTIVAQGPVDVDTVPLVGLDEAVPEPQADVIELCECKPCQPKTMPTIEGPLVIDQKHGNWWHIYHADCVELARAIPSQSIDFQIFSPPFASLYTYSNSQRDMGNCRSHSEFYEHFKFLAAEQLRISKPGRLLSFHCMNLPTSKAHDNVIGITDFRGLMIAIYQAAGWVYHSEVVIWKDPVTAMQRTHALGLLHMQLKKDSCMSRQGIPDYLINMVRPEPCVSELELDDEDITYPVFDIVRMLEALFPPSLVTMRHPSVNEERVSHTDDTFPVKRWQRYASPVWMDINPSDTLQYRSAREEKDEKHICPLQLEVIRRAIDLWTNPGDIVFSPFTGIGSEGYVSVQKGRKFVGSELKRSYFEQAARNLAAAEPEAAGSQMALMGGVM